MDPEVQSAAPVAEAPPAPPAEAPPDSGAEFARLSAELERQAQRADQAERYAYQQRREATGRAADAEWLQIKAQAPDPTLDPERALAYWEQVGLAKAQEAYNARLEAEQQLIERQQAQEKTVKSEAWITDTLANFAKRTGIRVERNDERLIKLRDVSWKQGTEAFLASLKAIEREAAASKRAVIEAGGGTFDSGPAGGAARQTSGFSLEQIRDPNFYAQNREAILADLDQRGAFAERRRRSA